MSETLPLSNIFNRGEKPAPEKDPLNFIAEERILLESLEKHEYEIPRDDLVALVARIFEHSPNDGFAMSERFQFTKQELETILGRSQFILKHKPLVSLIDARASLPVPLTDRPITPKASVSSDPAKQLLDTVDGHYAQYILLRNIESKASIKDLRSKDEKMGEQYLFNSILSTIRGNKVQVMSKLAKRDARARMMLQVEQSLNTDGRLGIVATAEQKLATDMLSKNLEESLTERELKLVFDTEHQKYTVESKNKCIPLTPEETEQVQALFLKNRDLLDMGSRYYEIHGELPSRYEPGQELWKQRCSEFDEEEKKVRHIIKKDTLSTLRVFLSFIESKKWKKSQILNDFGDLLKQQSTLDEFRELVREADLSVEVTKELIEKYEQAILEQKKTPEWIEKFEEKSLDFLERLFKEGLKEEDMFEGLAGCESERAWKMREELISKRGTYPSYLVLSLTGCESERAWKMREEIKKGVDRGDVAQGVAIRSLAGCDSERAWKMREEFLKKSGDKRNDAEGLVGCESERAWSMRERLMDEGVDKDYLAVSLKGCDSDRAGIMREELFKEISKLAISRSLIGCESEQAWNMRETLLKKENLSNVSDENVLRSLAGCDSERAWKMRETLLFTSRDNYVQNYFAESLAGCDDKTAWAMRESLLREGNVFSGSSRNLRFCALARSVSTFTLKLQHTKHQKHQLSTDEERKLKLLNQVTSFDKDSALAFLKENSVMKNVYALPEEDLTKEQIATSRQFKFIMNQLLKDATLSRDFLETVPAKSTESPRLLAEMIANKLRPPEKYSNEKPWWSAIGNMMKGERGTSSGGGEASPLDYLNTSSSHEFLDGDPGNGEKMDQKVFTLREAYHGMFVSSLFGSYNTKSKTWNKLEFPITEQYAETKETTVTIPLVSDGRSLGLPKPLHSRILHERIKSVSSNGAESTIPSTKNALGETTVRSERSSASILYSIQIDQEPVVVPDLTTAEYSRFKKSFEQSFDSEKTMSIDIVPLPREFEYFIQSINEKSPKEKVLAIEDFVRTVGYYDFDNGAVMDMKRGKSLEERLTLMKMRMQALSGKPELTNTEGKLVAGVCADFNLLTTALLRRAGVVSGVATGFRVSGTEATLANAHGTSFAVFPHERGGNKVILVDGTPSTGTPGMEKQLDQMRQPSLAQKDKEMEAFLDQKREESKMIISDIEKAFGDPEKMKELANGKLEQALNAILRYEVKQSHFEVLKRVFDAYHYSPISKAGLFNQGTDVDQSIEFLKQQINSVRKDESISPVIDKPAGTYLFNLIRDFGERLEKSKSVESQKMAYELIENLGDVTKDSLNDIEQRALTVVTMYLKAERMMKKQS